jgi:hypothetical protein
LLVVEIGGGFVGLCAISKTLVFTTQKTTLVNLGFGTFSKHGFLHPKTHKQTTLVNSGRPPR